MRIAIIHNLYQQPGGEDGVVHNESAWLKANGHDVLLLTRSNSTLLKMGALRGFLKVLGGIWWPPSINATIDEIKKFSPDVVHIHNLWYLFNPSLISKTKSLGIPVVITLHNFRLVCANSTLFRKGKVCHKCLGGTGYWGVIYKCYRGSYLLSLCVTLMSRLPKLLGVWRNDVDAYISLSKFSRDLFLQAGFPQEKIFLKPNFIPESKQAADNVKVEEPTALFIGRLSEEKGFPFLIKAWKRRKESLIVAGTGDAGSLPGNVRTLGQLDRESILKLIAKCWVVIVPSIGHETFGLVIAEAFMMGTPVLASRNGTFENIIENGRTGMLFKISDETEFQDKLDILFADATLRKTLAEAARREYENKFLPDSNGKILENIYSQVIEKKSHSQKRVNHHAY